MQQLTQDLRATMRDGSLLREECPVAGRWISAAERAQVRNPATGAVIGTVPMLDAAGVADAIDSAAAAIASWRARTAADRARLLRAWYELILQNADDLARIMTAEQGKPLAEARGEILYAASFIEWFAEEGRRIYGDLVPPHQAGKRILVFKEPVGVCCAITPWNFPAAMITRKVAPALAAGCTIVVKPATATPYSAFALAVLAERAGIPAGVFSVVTGRAEAVAAEMTSNLKVRKLSFTGSTEIGRKLLAQCAPTVKKTSMELGGNAPFIVFDDADLDDAVEGAIASKYRNNGQTCVCTNRFLVQEGIYDRFAAALADRVKGLRVGNGADEGTVLGPLIDQAGVRKVQEHVQDALQRGARLATGGRPHALGGLFYEPTVLLDVTSDMAVAREETFGPVAPLFRFRDEADAIRMANDTEFGLAAYFYGKDLSRMFRMAEALEYGIVGVNTGLVSTSEAPFGGMKQSGFGREGSKYGIEDYLELKYVCVGGVDA